MTLLTIEKPQIYRIVLSFAHSKFQLIHTRISSSVGESLSHGRRRSVDVLVKLPVQVFAMLGPVSIHPSEHPSTLKNLVVTAITLTHRKLGLNPNTKEKEFPNTENGD